MNPFDLPGTLFLPLYLLFGIGVTLVVVAIRNSMEPAEGPRLNLSDPYPIAYLRGGSGEVLRLATVSLVGGNFLKVEDDKITLPGGTEKKGTHPKIEAEVLQFFSFYDDPKQLFERQAALAVAETYKQRLTDLGLLPDDALRQRRMMLFGAAVAVLWGTALFKIVLALERGRHNIGFLIVLALIFTPVLYKLCTPKRTQLGKKVLKDLKTLLAGSLKTAKSHNGRGPRDETLLLAAVFGTATVAALGYGWIKQIYPKAMVNQLGVETSCGSSCGSSSCGSSGDSGGGSSCSSSSCGGGGGCGGCGS